MKKTFLSLIWVLCFMGTYAQKLTYGPVTIPAEAQKMGTVKDDMFTGFTPDNPNPELYYYDNNGVVFIYVVSLKADKSFNGMKVIRITTANIAPGNFMAEGVAKTDFTEVNIYTRAKNVVETFTFFEFDMPSSEPPYEYALQLNINVMDKTKATELVNLLNAKQKK